MDKENVAVEFDKTVSFFISFIFISFFFRSFTLVVILFLPNLLFAEQCRHLFREIEKKSRRTFYLYIS